MPLPGTGMRRAAYHFCPWKRKTQRPKPAISGASPPLSGAADHLRLVHIKFSGKEYKIRECPYKEKCTRAKWNKRLYISRSFLEKRQDPMKTF